MITVDKFVFCRPKGVDDSLVKPYLGERSPHWPTVRAAWLFANNRCICCGTTDFLEVHHIEPFHEHPERELDSRNFATLCEKPGHNCHFIWGHFYNWKRFNPNVLADVAAWKEKINEPILIPGTAQSNH